VIKNNRENSLSAINFRRRIVWSSFAAILYIGVISFAKLPGLPPVGTLDFVERISKFQGNFRGRQTHPAWRSSFNFRNFKSTMEEMGMRRSDEKLPEMSCGLQ
jgi:hypothetical protein